MSDADAVENDHEGVVDPDADAEDLSEVENSAPEEAAREVPPGLPLRVDHTFGVVLDGVGVAHSRSPPSATVGRSLRSTAEASSMRCPSMPSGLRYIRMMRTTPRRTNWSAAMPSET